MSVFKILAKHKNRILPAGAVVLSLVLGFVYLYQVRNVPSFAIPEQGTDMHSHHKYAVDIIKGKGFPELTNYSPLYPFVFLPFLYLFFGVNLITVYIVQVIMGAACVVMTYLIARRLFNNAVAVLSAYIHSLYGFFIIYYGALLSEVLLNLVVLAAIWSFLVVLDREETRYKILCGLLFGLSALAKPTMLTFILFLAIPLFAKKGINKKSILDMAIIFVFAAFAILPVTIRNYRITGGFFPVSSGGSVVFLMGNMPDSAGTYFYTQEVNRIQEETKDMSVLEREKIFKHKVFSFMKERPFDFLGILCKKFCLFWGGWHIPNNLHYYLNYYFYSHYNLLRPPLLDFPFLIPWELLVAFGATGIVLSLKKWKKLLTVYLFILIYPSTIMFFIVLGRFRLPVVPFLSIFTAATILSVAKSFSDKSFGKIAGAAVLAVVILFLEYGYAGILFSPSGIYTRKDNFLIVRDERMRVAGVKGLDDAAVVARKDIILNFDPQEYKRVWLQCLMFVKNPGYLRLSVNGKEVSSQSCKTSAPGDYGYPFLIQEFPVSLLVRGRNVIVIAPLDETEVFFYVDPYAKYGRSWVLNRDNGNEKKVRGEFVIRLELQK